MISQYITSQRSYLLIHFIPDMSSEPRFFSNSSCSICHIWCISEEMAQLSYLRMYLVVYCVSPLSHLSLQCCVAVTSLSILKYYTQFRYGTTSILMSDITLRINTDPSQYSYSSLSITRLKQLNGSVSTHECLLRFRASVKKKDGVDVYVSKIQQYYLVIKGLNVRHSICQKLGLNV